MNEALASQLGEARESKSRLEQGGLSDTELDTALTIPDSDDPAVLHEALKQHAQRIQEQSTALKKLRFDLEMERGQVNILRHDNQRLKQLTVELVSKMTCV
jgi:hypothetical protein